MVNQLIKASPWWVSESPNGVVRGQRPAVDLKAPGMVLQPGAALHGLSGQQAPLLSWENRLCRIAAAVPHTKASDYLRLGAGTGR